MRKTLTTLFLGTLAVSAFAQTTVPFAAGDRALATPAGVAPSSSNCSFIDKHLPADTIVVAAGSYSGRKLSFQIDQSGHEATQFDVAVHSDKPVALLLGAYEPTVWSIGWTKGTRIVAVFATGYHRQAVAGLPKETPVITTFLSGNAGAPCGSNYINESGLQWVNPKSRTVFGKDAARVYNRANNGLLDIVESTKPKSDYVTSPDTKPESFRDTKAPLAGSAGLEEAVSKGLVRPATSADLDLVRKHFLAALPKTAAGKPDVPPVAGGSRTDAAPEVRLPMGLHRAYVVLKPFTYPAGLYGANLATFIISKGVPVPSGEPGHSMVVNLNVPGSCSGALCPRPGY